MNRRTRIASIAAAAILVGCAGQGDIDRTQPDKVEKSIFFTKDPTTGRVKPKVWYYRQVVSEVPPNTSVSFEGLYGELYKVRFEITENFLVGYRSHDLYPGLENEFTTGLNNNEAPLLVFPISSHFDVKRQYISGTGEQTNVIEENSSDRPWFDRQYMRVDWTKNVNVDASAAFSWFDTVENTTTNYWVSQAEISNPDRPILSKSYIDWVSKYQLKPDINACAAVYYAWDDGYQTAYCGPAEVKVRNALMEVKPSTYEPRPYNNSEYSKFGIFRTVVQEYDRQAGARDFNRRFYANRWNLWQETKDASGNPLPFSARKTKPITWYTNPEYPEETQLWDMTKGIVAEWNNAFKYAVAGMQLTEANGGAAVSLDEIKAKAATGEDMVVMKQNSCNLANVKTHVTTHGFEKLVKDITGAPVADLTKADLLKVCAALMATTENLEDTDAKKFVWQRNGDLRFSFIHWVDRVQLSGPLGYGPSSADPETGEIISAGLHQYGAAVDTYAYRATEFVRAINGDLSINNTISGKTVKDFIDANKADRQRREAMYASITPEARTTATAAMRRGFKANDPERMRQIRISPGATSAKWEKLKGSVFERERLLGAEILYGRNPGLKPGQQPTAEQLDRASPANWITPAARQRKDARMQKQLNHRNGCLYMAEFADDAILGLALELADLPHDELFKKLRAAIYRGLALHEMGHTLGMAHNFEASSDALNYFDDFWKIRTTVPKADWAKNRLREYQYSTVMDYGAKFNSDIQGLGKYDFAAIRYSYGNLIDVMPNASQSGGNLSGTIFLDDYTALPAAVGGEDVIAEIQVRKEMAPPTGSDTLADDERPYKFCDLSSVITPYCKQWDEGANQTEIINNAIDGFHEYYFFNAYRRGRLSWEPWSYLDQLTGRVFNRFSETFQWYYFYGDLFEYYQDAYGIGRANADDLLRAAMLSLNTLGEVLSTPEPGSYCTTTMNPNVYTRSSTGCTGSTMNIALGTGKEYYADYSDDPYFYNMTSAGSFYEKLAGLVALTSSEAMFSRIDSYANADSFSINFYRVFKDEMLKLINGVVRNEPGLYGGHVVSGKWVPTPVVDPATFGKVNPTTPSYANAPKVNTPSSRMMRYYALLLALGNLNTGWDNQLDIGQYMRVALKDSTDDLFLDVTDPALIREYTHPESKQVYRALRYSVQKAGIAAEVVDELNNITGKPGDVYNPADAVTARIDPRFGSIETGKAYPTWYAAKEWVSRTGLTQAEYDQAREAFEYLQYLVGYRVDLVNDLRDLRRVFAD